MRRRLRILKWAGSWWVMLSQPERVLQRIGRYRTWDEAMTAADRATKVLAP